MTECQFSRSKPFNSRLNRSLKEVDDLKAEMVRLNLYSNDKDEEKARLEKKIEDFGTAHIFENESLIE